MFDARLLARARNFDWRQAAALYRETFGKLEFIEDESATPDAIELETITV